jgi:hypothetical protein
MRVSEEIYSPGSGVQYHSLRLETTFDFWTLKTLAIWPVGRNFLRSRVTHDYIRDERSSRAVSSVLSLRQATLAWSDDKPPRYVWACVTS